MTRSAYWYPLNDWEVGDGPPSVEDVEAMALRLTTMGVTDVVLGIDGRKLNATWNYLETFDSQTFRADLSVALDRLFDAGYDGTISFMPVNGLYNWESDNHARTYWAVNATLRFIETSPHRDKVTSIVTDTEFAPTEEWQTADDAGKADILRQYVELLKGINDRVKAFDADLETVTYHGSYLDKGDTRFELDGVNYGDSAVLAAHVDTIILPIRLTDAIDPDVDHDFDSLISRAANQSADELANLAGTGKTILLDFEWEEANRGFGAPNYFAQVEAAIADAVRDHPSFQGFTVWISTGGLSDVPLSDITVMGADSDDALAGTTGDDLIDAGAGADTLVGGAGHDRLLAGAGSDAVSGGSGNDSMSGGYGADTLMGGNNNDRLFGNDGHDVLSGGAGRDWLVGGRHDDLMDGGLGNDHLNGQEGRDTLSGGQGKDRLIGGSAADAFVFAEADFGDDTINDFTSGEDLLVFTGSFAEVSSFAAFSDALTQVGGNLVFDLDGDGVNRLQLNGLTLDALSDEDVQFLML